MMCGLSFRRRLLALGVLFFLCVMLVPAWTAPLLYRMKIGQTYHFEITTRTEVEMTGFELREKLPVEAKDSVTVRVLAFRNGVYVLDIEQGNRHFRRLMRENGTLVMTPGERGIDLPVFLPFPAGDWQVGKPTRVDFKMPADGQDVPARWEALLASRDAAKGLAQIKLAGVVDLPSDRVIQRKLTVKGTLTFDEKAGCPSAGDWQIEYLFELANKEIAVIRPMYKFRELRVTSFKLTGVDAKGGN